MSAEASGGNHRHTLSLDLPAAHSGVRVARNIVRNFVRLLGLDGRGRDELLLVLSELLANAIDHSAGEGAMTVEDLDSDVRMHMDVMVTAVEWSVAVTDEGGGDPELVGTRFDEQGFPDLEDERGRGLFLMKEMVDRLEVEASADGRGLTIRATKRHVPA